MEKLKSLSLFTGIGGMDYGCEAAGFKTVLATDIDQYATEHLIKNTDWPVLNHDIHLISSDEILERTSTKPGEIDLLTAGPPCQPFSKSGYWHQGETLRLNDQRANTIGKFLELIEKLRPKSILFENVPAICFKNKDEGLQWLLAGLEQINERYKTNYRPFYKVLNSAGYGVPQFRERFFLIASIEGKEFVFPEYTHFDVDDLNHHHIDGTPFVTSWDALHDLEIDKTDPELEITGKWADLLPSIPEGRNYLWHTNRGGGASLFGWRTRYWSFLLKLAKNKPSWTIQSNPGSSTGPFHWDNRKLSIKELCRLQTLPWDLEFAMNLKKAQVLIGNAVPSLMAEVIGNQIQSQYFSRNLLNKKLKFKITKSVIQSKEEKVKRIPKKYYEYMGKHADHPGPGKGPRINNNISSSIT